MISPENQKRLRSKWWRLNHLYKIKDKEGNLITFKPNFSQKKHYKDRGTHKRCKILKARQKGFTTSYCIEYLDQALWIPGSAVAILAHRQEDVTKLFEIVKRAYENLPDVLKPVTRYDNKNELVFEQDFTGRKLDSKIYVSMKLRSGTVTHLHISESAYIKDRQELNAGSKQALGKHGMLTEETTGNGFNQFYDETMQDVRGWDSDDGIPQEYKTKVLFYPWYIDSEYTLPYSGYEMTPFELELIQKHPEITPEHITWRRWKVKELGTSEVAQALGMSGEQLFKQEYPSTLHEAFQSSGGTYFDQDMVAEIKCKQPLSVIEGLTTWYEPEVGAKYVIGGDPSTGRGVDFTSINVWRIDGVQVAQWHGYCDPIEGADIAKTLAEKYNNAFVGIENNMLTMALTLSRNYHNCYQEVIINKATEQRTSRVGWTTNMKTRPVMMDEFRQEFESGELEINSEVTKSEMQTFVIKNEKRVKIEHDDGKHDDSLFADFIAIQMIKQMPQEAVMVRALKKGQRNQGLQVTPDGNLTKESMQYIHDRRRGRAGIVRVT